MINIGESIAQYAELRENLDKIRKEFKMTEKALKQEMVKLEMDILESQREVGLTSSSNLTHTAFQIKKTFVRISDWDEFSNFILNSGNVQLLEKRVAKLAALELFEADGVVPSDIGLNKEEEIAIQIRKK